MASMTPAVRLLEQAGVEFSLHQFDVADAADGRHRYGVEAADALGLDPAQVFKTLIVVAGKPAVAIIPVAAQLSLKRAGAAFGVKRVELCDPAVAERTTGYVAGGISPFGQRSKLATAIDESAIGFDTIYVSGGKRGLDLGVAPADLVAVLDATVAQLT